MFFVLSKTIGLLLNPLILILLLVLLGYWKKKYRKQFTLLALGLFLFFSSPLTANLAMDGLEFEPGEIPNNSKNVGVVLTGIISHGAQVNDQLAISGGAERIVDPVQLYHQGKLDKLLIVGGSGLLNDQEFSESKDLKSIAIGLKVLPDDILIETESRNTHENAVFAGEMISKELPDHHPILITSAFHMKRALGCFKKEGIDVQPYPVDFRTSYNLSNLDFWLPNPDAMEMWHRVIRELFGIVAYRFSGYI